MLLSSRICAEALQFLPRHNNTRFEELHMHQVSPMAHLRHCFRFSFLFQDFRRELTLSCSSCASMSKRRRFRWPRLGRGMSGDAAGRQTWQQPGRPRSRSGGEKERGPSTSDEVVIRSQGKWPRRPSPLWTSPRGRLRGCRGRCRGRGRLVFFFIFVYFCHYAILTPFPARLFPLLP